MLSTMGVVFAFSTAQFSTNLCKTIPEKDKRHRNTGSLFPIIFGGEEAAVHRLRFALSLKSECAQKSKIFKISRQQPKNKFCSYSRVR